MYCGVIDAEKIGLVTAIERIVEHVFMEALAYPSADCEDESLSCPMIKNQLLPGLRSFCSALRGTFFETISDKSFYVSGFSL